MQNIYILYGSQTGQTEMLANSLKESANKEYFNLILIDME